MPDRCVVVGCSIIPDTDKGIKASHKIPFYSDKRNQAKTRWKKWMDFVE